MLRRVLAFVQYRASWKVIVGLFAVSALLMIVMNGTELPFSTPTIEEHSGGLAILDTRSSYSPADAYALFEGLGTEGRRAYLTLHLVPDTAFPIAYALVFAFTSAWFLVRLLPLDHRLQWLSLIPLVSGSADVLENLLLVIANLTYPDRADGMVRLANVLTRIKFGLLPIGLAFLTVIVVVWLVRKRPGSNVPKVG